MEFNSKKQEDISHFKQNAMRLEEQALDARRDKKSAEVIGSFYEKAGDMRLKAKDFAQAEENYVKAKRLGYPYDEDKLGAIDEKINSLRLQKKRHMGLDTGQNSGWKSYSYVILSITSLLAALGFVSISLTGNIINELNQDRSRLMGLCFFICGLIFSFLYLKGKKR
jgi:hypothetical protein